MSQREAFDVGSAMEQESRAFEIEIGSIVDRIMADSPPDAPAPRLEVDRDFAAPGHPADSFDASDVVAIVGPRRFRVGLDKGVEEACAAVMSAVQDESSIEPAAPGRKSWERWSSGRCAGCRGRAERDRRVVSPGLCRQFGWATRVDLRSQGMAHPAVTCERRAAMGVSVALVLGAGVGAGTHQPLVGVVCGLVPGAIAFGLRSAPVGGMAVAPLGLSVGLPWPLPIVVVAVGLSLSGLASRNEPFRAASVSFGLAHLAGLPGGAIGLVCASILGLVPAALRHHVGFVACVIVHFAVDVALFAAVVPYVVWVGSGYGT